MELINRFDEIFENVCEELNVNGWWEVYDNTKNMAIVNARIAKEFGADIFDSDEYIEWDSQMADEL